MGLTTLTWFSNIAVVGWASEKSSSATYIARAIYEQELSGTSRVVLFRFLLLRGSNP